ncbi:hypothetical protein CEXT_702801 [Caerostris extrusa]|uniref:Uncharacterized protein n=1 Tax=Caerostris extrusa TaxID=172846 RepID=A0AAV4Q3N9_CAEEX|nr:hypothetical protein CEXT_702801 [Caerostris extrusa]
MGGKNCALPPRGALVLRVCHWVSRVTWGVGVEGTITDVRREEGVEAKKCAHCLFCVHQYRKERPRRSASAQEPSPYWRTRDFYGTIDLDGRLCRKKKKKKKKQQQALAAFFVVLLCRGGPSSR